MTRITLVRHGRTDVNARGLLLGRLDPPLDDLGRQQAALVAKALAGSKATKVVASPLQRCQQTAAVVAEALGLGVTVDQRWIEIDYGELDGVPIDSVPLATWGEWMADVGWTPPGGESIAAMGVRVQAACEDLVTVGDDVIVVSHVSPVKAAVAWALQVSDAISWRMFVSPASISRIEHVRGRATLHAFNDVSHLASLG